MPRGFLGFARRPEDAGAAASAAAEPAPVGLERLAQPALLTGADGAVIEANGRAWQLARALAEGALPEAREAIAGAASRGVGRTEPVRLPEALGGARYELAVVPLADGRALVLARAMALEHNLRQALVESRQRYKDLVEASSDFAWEVGPDGAFAFVSPRGALGWAADDLVGRQPAEFLAPGDDPAGPMDPFRAIRPVEGAEIRFRRADGGIACLSASALPLLDEAGGWAGARGVCRDVTEDRERDAALARAHTRERLFGYIIRTMRDEIDPLDMLEAAAAAVARALTARGTAIHRAEDATGRPGVAFGAPASADLGDLIDRAAQTRGPVSVEGPAGHALAVATRYRDRVNGVLALWRDPAPGAWTEDERALAAEAAEHLGIAIEQAANHERLQELSRTDGLTGVLNRRSFLAELERRFLRASQGGTPGALVYCDLDNFKQVNDVHGHERGDAAIRQLAGILVGATRGADLVARLGGDEFALWLEATEEVAAAARAEELLARAAPLAAHSGGPDCPLGLSLGIAVTDPAAGETLTALMARADAAMYASKRAGKGRCTIAPPPGGAAAPTASAAANAASER